MFRGGSACNGIGRRPGMYLKKGNGHFHFEKDTFIEIDVMQNVVHYFLVTQISFFNKLFSYLHLFNHYYSFHSILLLLCEGICENELQGGTIEFYT